MMWYDMMLLFIGFGDLVWAGAICDSSYWYDAKCNELMWYEVSFRWARLRGGCLGVMWYEVVSWCMNWHEVKCNELMWCESCFFGGRSVVSLYCMYHEKWCDAIWCGFVSIEMMSYHFISCKWGWCICLKPDRAIYIGLVGCAGKLVNLMWCEFVLIYPLVRRCFTFECRCDIMWHDVKWCDTTFFVFSWFELDIALFPL